MTGFTLLVIRVESVDDSALKDFEFEAEAYPQCILYSDADLDKDERFVKTRMLFHPFSHGDVT